MVQRVVTSRLPPEARAGRLGLAGIRRQRGGDGRGGLVRKVEMQLFGISEWLMA